MDFDHQHRLRKAGFSLDRYFNSGVMVFDLAAIRRKQNLVSDLESFFRNYPESLMVDQDLLNWIYADKYYCLPEKYNKLVKCNRNWDGASRNIWHFSGLKPWERYESPVDILYWKALALSPWQDQVLDGVLRAADAKMHQVLNSRSWRMTRPYRVAGDWVRSRLGCFR